MTSGEWSGGPYAAWIREGLEARGKNKTWLSKEVAAKRGVGKDSAEKNVNRWTVHDVAPVGENLDLLTKLFGPPPTALEAETYRDHERRMAKLEAQVVALTEALAAADQADTDLRRRVAILEKAKRPRARTQSQRASQATRRGRKTA